MISVQDYYKRFLEETKPFFDSLVEKDKALFRDTLFLSFLGARICYASTRPLNLFAEKRFREREEFLSFLRRLKLSGHASVFAHSPVVVNESLSPEKMVRLSQVLFKAWWAHDGSVCLNLRHFAEVYEEKEFMEILEASYEKSHAWQEFQVFEIAYHEGKAEIVQRTTLGKLISQTFNEPEGIEARPQVFVIDVAPSETKPFGWLAVVAEGFSRLFSHQFVRHTWLNFNQRSHRYTQVDQFVFPPSFDDEARAIYTRQIEEGLHAYQNIVKRGVKKEDARFITPQGSSTTILATGPYFVWEDFVNKRNHPKAQWEIRRLAEGLALVLRELKA
ncbi:thymidylate synthase complementing protein ThyX [Thermodesulfatator indicus DSM 15286]|uniref:Thymidylate synthase complementing protein ThyX n=1 Tax=Thermodesulfatator indicus (strain DSM 15286 / JCM 11887 / CIR29812) TaxID=667014 RepID=F8A8T3_THEID|nr:FAD-dependent thymidylate synthase [Thermodesulfatator indicus]AEH45058.1 thymidylate synthase complementing protein ThyX [Thermodesulfatator indicus DSM 15286]